MYPPSSLPQQSVGPVPTYPVSSAYGPPAATQGTPSAIQPGSVPTYPPSGPATKAVQYPTPLSSKPSPVGPGVGVRSAAVTSNYTGSLSDGFNSMHLQVRLLLLPVHHHRHSKLDKAPLTGAQWHRTDIK